MEPPTPHGKCVKLETSYNYHKKIRLGGWGTEGAHNAINEARQIRDDSRNVRIGRVLGSLAYYLLQQGHSKTDFVLLVDLLSKAGCDVGQVGFRITIPIYI